MRAFKKQFLISSLGRRARYIEVRAVNKGSIPSWHAAGGQKAWLFVDEIAINPKRR